MKKLILIITILFATISNGQISIGVEAGVDMNAFSTISYPQTYVGVQAKIYFIHLSYTSTNIASAGFLFKATERGFCVEGNNGALLGINWSEDLNALNNEAIVIGGGIGVLFGYDWDGRLSVLGNLNMTKGFSMGILYNF